MKEKVKPLFLLALPLLLILAMGMVTGPSGKKAKSVSGFEAIQNSVGTCMRWSTLQEKEVHRFIIQKSVSGGEWESELRFPALAKDGYGRDYEYQYRSVSQGNEDVRFRMKVVFEDGEELVFEAGQ